MQLRIGAVSAIYNKSLRLSTVGSTKTTTAGELSNLASNDVERFLYASLFISYLFWAPMEAVAVLCVGLHTLGPAFAAGYIVLFTFVPMQFYLGHKFANSRSQIAKLTDKRVSLISQAIQGVRVMKMNGWEFEFSERISQLRGEEVKSVQVASKYRALNEAIFYATNTSVAICIFVVHVLTGHELNTHDVFATLTLINIVQFTMTKFFAYSVMSCSECYVSVQRIQHFLELPELKDTSTVINDGQSIIEMSNVSSFWGPPVMLSHEEVSEKDERHLKRLITRKNAPRSPISWMTREKPNDIVSSKGPIVSRRRSDQVETMVRAPAVENVSLMLDPGRLYCVVGPVGCGKSALLMTIAGELQPDFGSIKRTVSSVAFAAQTAWIMDGTLRENVLMGREYVRAKYEEVIHACGLSPDISRFHLGDQTLLGDRGIQCSKFTIHGIKMDVLRAAHSKILRRRSTSEDRTCSCFVRRCGSDFAR
jgi:ATP-binding cassette subfamily C (CFTR/MRP) protein 4